MILNRNILYFIALLLPLSLPVQAGDYRHKNSISIHLGNHHNGLHLSYAQRYKYKDCHYYKHKYRSDYKRPHYKYKKRGYSRHYKPYGYNKYSKYKKYYKLRDKYRDRYSGYRQYKKRCHPVSKVVTDRYGYRHDIGGTMCYDRRGHAYIVPGSRYKLH